MKRLEVLARRLQIASDPSRIKILCKIFDKKKICVSDIADQLDMSVAIVSHHLQKLTEEDILEPLRDGKMVCYELKESEFINDLKNFICKYK